MHCLIKSLCDRGIALAYLLFPVMARGSIAWTFWASGRTKVDGWQFWTPTQSTIFLFSSEYRLPILSPEWAATLASISEHVFPILLILGFYSRISAAALLGMTIVIQIFVFPHLWPVHSLWAACLLGLIAYGPGPLSLDNARLNVRSR